MGFHRDMVGGVFDDQMERAENVKSRSGSGGMAADFRVGAIVLALMIGDIDHLHRVVMGAQGEPIQEFDLLGV